VSELLDPEFIWEEPEGYRDAPAIAPVGSSLILGRPAIAASLEITDWATRGIGWSETLFPAETYELTVDRETGILLSVISIYRSQPVSSCIIDSLAFGDSPGPEFFKVDKWINGGLSAE